MTILKVFLLAGLLFSTVAHAVPDVPELVIYTYDSLLAKDGLGSRIFPVFEKRYGCRVRALAWGDGGQILTRLEVDRKRGKPVAHLILGVDQQTRQTLSEWIEPWGAWRPKGYERLAPHLGVPSGFLPYDYGYLAMMADRKGLQKLGLEPPKALADLISPQWKRNIILEDPRTSTPGLGFLIFSERVFGNSVWNFWTQLKSHWLTLTPGWDGAYRLFLRGEAPLVWSYVTSQAYHEEHPSPDQPVGRYQALLFKEGQPLQIEGVTWVKGLAQNPALLELGKKFMEFMISPEVQTQIPRTQWMYPVRNDIELPDSFKHLPIPTRIIPLASSAEEVKNLLDRWMRTAQ